MTIEVKHPDLKLLHEKLREHMNAHSNAMINGACEDYAQYKAIVGTVEGLALAERELLDIDEMLYRGEEDEQD